MKISVVTVCFNAAQTIADTMESIRCQSHPDVEYIVVDGKVVLKVILYYSPFGKKGVYDRVVGRLSAL